MLPTTMFQLIDPWKFQRMKKVGAAQTKIQLLLLGDLLSSWTMAAPSWMPCSSRQTLGPSWQAGGSWEQRLADLSAVMDSFLAMMVPGRLHVKHRQCLTLAPPRFPTSGSC